MNDHLKKNVDFEGVFPEGKPGAGPTMLWDNGFYAPLPGYSNIEECFQRGYFRFTIYGKKLQGNWTLTWAEETRCSQYGSVWYLIKDDDAYARTASAPAITIASPLSVNLGLTLQQVKSKFLAGKAKHPPQSVTLFDI